MKGKKRRRVIFYTDKELTREERRNYKKDHPGERLAIPLRFPKLPDYISVVAMIYSLCAVLYTLITLLRL